MYSYIWDSLYIYCKKLFTIARLVAKIFNLEPITIRCDVGHPVALVRNFVVFGSKDINYNAFSAYLSFLSWYTVWNTSIQFMFGLSRHLINCSTQIYVPEIQGVPINMGIERRLESRL